MNQIKLFIELTRLKKPIGFMLLFWPCAWGLTLAYDFSSNLKNYFFYIILFVSIRLGMFYAFVLCLLALLVLINFNFFTIILALASMPLAFTYPLMKRLTYWPQFFLGITFNYGLILGWTAINDEIELIPILFYLGAIFWTLGYDTIYGYQDIKDDEIIGLKSTSIKFKGKAKKFLIICYTSLIIFFLIGAYSMNLNYNFYLFMIVPFIHLFLYQIKIFNLKDPSSCLKAFKSNNFLGLLIFLNILIAKI